MVDREASLSGSNRGIWALPFPGLHPPQIGVSPHYSNNAKPRSTRFFVQPVLSGL